MKKNFILPMLFIASLSLLACSNSKSTYQEENDIAMNNFFSENKNFIKRDLQLQNFHGIENNGGLEIIYTQGNTYKVTYEGTEKLLSIYRFKVDNGVLKVNTKKTVINGHDGVILHITAPNIDLLNNHGSLTMKANNWASKNLSIKNCGAMTLKATIKGTGYTNIQNTGALTYKDGSIAATSVSFKNSGASTISIPFQLSDTFCLQNSGASKLTSDIKTKSYKETCNGASTDKVNIQADDIDMDIDGAGKVDINFKGKNANIKGKGCSTINLATDCDKLNITSSGASKIKVKGTADSTNISNSGITKVDASELNKF